jgi:hypothetical protein
MQKDTTHFIIIIIIIYLFELQMDFYPVAVLHFEIYKLHEPNIVTL